MHVTPFMPLGGSLSGVLPNPGLSADAAIERQVFGQRIAWPGNAMALATVVCPVGGVTLKGGDGLAATRESILTLINNAAPSGGSWSLVVGGGTQFSTGYFVVAQGVPSASNWEFRGQGSGVFAARLAVSSPSFNSSVTGRGDAAMLAWTNTGGSFNGRLDVGHSYIAGSGTSDLRNHIVGSSGVWSIFRADTSTELARMNGSGRMLIGSSTDDATNTLQVTGTIATEGANGSYWARGSASELLALSTSGTTTDTSANLLPADSIIEAVTARVTTTITTATNWKLGDATTAGRFTAAISTLTAGTTTVGTVHADQTGAAGPRQTSAAKVRVTTTGTPGAGAIRITVYYRTFVPPTS